MEIWGGLAPAPKRELEIDAQADFLASPKANGAIRRAKIGNLLGVRRRSDEVVQAAVVAPVERVVNRGNQADGGAAEGRDGLLRADVDVAVCETPRLRRRDRTRERMRGLPVLEAEALREIEDVRVLTRAERSNRAQLDRQRQAEDAGCGDAVALRPRNVMLAICGGGRKIEAEKVIA